MIDCTNKKRRSSTNYFILFFRE